MLLERKMEKLCSTMEEDDTFYIEEEFQSKDCDKKEQLRRIRKLEEQRNLQEQKEIELERIQRQIVNKLNITDKSDNEMKYSNTGKPLSNTKPNSKQNEIHTSSKTDIQTSSNIAQKSHDKRTVESYKSASSFRSDRNLSHDRSPYYKGTCYRRDGFHSTHQRRSHRVSRGRSSYRRYHERMQNQNRFSIGDYQHEFDFNEKQKIDHLEKKIKEYSEFELLPELIPASVEEEEDMLKEAIELSKQQMFIEKLEKREIDKVIGETIINQEQHLNGGRKPQRQFDNRTVCKKNKDISRTSFSNSTRGVISSENKQGANYNKREKNDYSKINFSGNSKLEHPNKIQEHGLNDDKQNINVTINKNSHHRQGAKTKHLYQTNKKSLETYKQNPNVQTEPIASRSDFVKEPLMQPYSDRTADYDTNSSSWKESARKDLKQLLHLDNSPDASIEIVDVENITKANTVHCDTDTGDSSNKYETYLGENNHFYQKENYREKSSTRRFTKSHYNSSRIGNGNNYDMPIKCSDCFKNYGAQRAGNRSRLSERRYLRTQYSSRTNNNNINDSESVCVNWKPYPKLMGGNRTENIPPRFRK